MSTSTDGTFCDEFDRLHGRVFNAVESKYDRPLRLQVPYWFRRLFRSRALRLSEMPGHGFIKRGMQWPRVVKVPIKPEAKTFLDAAKAHFSLCIQCNDREAVSDMLLFSGIQEFGRRGVEEFIKENTTDEVWFKLRREV